VQKSGNRPQHLEVQQDRPVLLYEPIGIGRTDEAELERRRNRSTAPSCPKWEAWRADELFGGP
jgi:hypothetical protein